MLSSNTPQHWRSPDPSGRLCRLLPTFWSSLCVAAIVLSAQQNIRARPWGSPYGNSGSRPCAFVRLLCVALPHRRLLPYPFPTTGREATGERTVRSRRYKIERIAPAHEAARRWRGDVRRAHERGGLAGRTARAAIARPAWSRRGRLHQVALDAEHELILRAHEPGLQPRPASSTSLVRAGKNISISKKGLSCSTMRWMVVFPSWMGVGHKGFLSGKDASRSISIVSATARVGLGDV
jgi:hypothetical protein